MSAIALTARVGESAALADLLTRGGSSAAVILMDTDVLGHVYPRCNWKTPLLRLRNRLADDGVKVFAALELSSPGGTVSATRARAANGMMTILRGTIVQDLMWTKGYGAVSGMLSLPSNVAKGVAPIVAASIWNFTRGYVAVEWTVFLVSILSVIAFFFGRSGQPPRDDRRCMIFPASDSSTHTFTMKIRAARSDDLDAIKALLAKSGLPNADVTGDLLFDFAVAEDADGSVVGSVGLERFGTNALLRSLAVAQPARNDGLGGHMLAHAEDRAHASGILELWLLTTTALEFFQRKGYVDVARSSVPVEIHATRQFAQLCPATAVCMRKTLSP
ncbi:arsenic resistance N-acetyltransferase ArsN2 [Paraburkholderia terrae]|nr:arsenic resistance N-acetyltransferase ArsN2 [Paraburkholderia terrae]